MNTDTDTIFNERDLTLIESLEYDPSLKSMYCSFRMYLHWPDELPSGITPEGYDTLCDLWIARACLHHGLKLHESLNPEAFTNVWNKALAQGLKWPGFNRVALSDEDKEYYQQMLNQENPFD